MRRTVHDETVVDESPRVAVHVADVESPDATHIGDPTGGAGCRR